MRGIITPAARAAALLLLALAAAQAPAAGREVAQDVSAPASAPDTQLRQDDEAYAKLPVCTLSKDGKRLAVEPCRTAPAADPMPRRPVPQTIARMPRSQQAPQVAMPATPPSIPLETLRQPPGAPIPLGGCVGAACSTPNGTLINNGPAGTAVTPAGKVCRRNGAWLQC